MKKVSFPLRGINRSSPGRSGADDTAAAQDGDCDEIINLRYKNGAWRPVGEPSDTGVSLPKTFLTGSEVSYFMHELASGTDILLAWKNGAYDTPIYYAVTGGTVSYHFSEAGAGEKEITAIGNVLIISNKSQAKIIRAIFSVAEGKYYAIASMPVLRAGFFVSKRIFTITYPITLYYNLTPDLSEDDPTYYVKYVDRVETAHRKTSGIISGKVEYQLQQNNISGVVLLQAAIELIDGSTVSYTPLTVVAANDTPCVFRMGLNGAVIFYRLILGQISCNLSISGMSSALQNKLIRSVNIYSSRIVPLFDFDRPFVVEEKMDNGIVYLNAKELAVNPAVADYSFINREPLYLLKKFSLQEIGVDTVLDFRKSGTGTAIPNDEFTSHNLYADSISAINERLVMGSTQTELYNGYKWRDFTMHNSTSFANNPVVAIEVDGEEFRVSNSESVFPGRKGPAPCGLLLSYPDVRATEMNVQTSGSSGTIYSFKLTKHPLLNLSYAMVVPKMTFADGYNGELAASKYFFSDYTYEKMTEIGQGSSGNVTNSFITRVGMLNKVMLGTFEADDFALNPTVSTLPTVTESRVAFRKNRLQLTEVGMPFSFPAKLSYALDGDVIGVAQNSIPLSTGQFGEHPLLIATSSGWRAAQIGTGDVYVEAILPLNGIVAKSKELIVNANANVAFATDNALFVMRGSELTKISAPLDGGSDGEVAGIAATAAHKQLSGLDPGVLGADFKAYLAGAYLAYNVRENELIVHSNAYAYAYVFSFDGGAWSKHTAPYRRLISAYPRILYVDDSRNLMSLADETPAVKPVLMLTRGMRLDESAYKRVDRLFANGQLRVPGVTDDRNDGVPYRYFRAGLYLSYDGTKYVMVDKKDIKSYALNASWLSSGCSAKFFKLLLCGQALPESCLTTVDVEVSEGLGS